MGSRKVHASPAERAEWLADMRETLPPGSTVYTVLRHRSASGMLREIDVQAIQCEPDGRIVRPWLSYRVAALLGYSLGDRDGLRVAGAGMDMGYHVAYSLSRVLYPDGFDCIGLYPGNRTGGRSCPSNDHTNGQRYYGPGVHHADGGYALRHEWL